jgi:hypothetical protein
MINSYYISGPGTYTVYTTTLDPSIEFSPSPNTAIYNGLTSGTAKKDALTIARFLLDHHEEISQLSIPQDHQDLRDLSRERESLCHLISATKGEIKGVLRTIFPELESIGKLYSGVRLRFLQQYPSARLVRGAKRKAIAKALRGPYVGDKLTFTAEEIVKAAQVYQSDMFITSSDFSEGV